MKTIFTTIVLLFAIFITSCDCNSPIGQSKIDSTYRSKGIIRKFTWDETPHGVSVIKIDSCEYIYSEAVYNGFMNIIHKANCSNPIHIVKRDTVYIPIYVKRILDKKSKKREINYDSLDIVLERKDSINEVNKQYLEYVKNTRHKNK